MIKYRPEGGQIVKWSYRAGRFMYGEKLKNDGNDSLDKMLIFSGKSMKKGPSVRRLFACVLKSAVENFSAYTVSVSNWIFYT